MWKALLKKQFLELLTFYFPKSKAGKKRSTGAIVGFILLFVFIILSLGGSFYAAADMLAAAMLPMGLGWLYFALLGSLSIFLGVFGGVFSTYSGLYLARDNDLLLSLPIPPRRILLTRMIAIFVAGLVYSAVAWIPGVIRYLLFDASAGPLAFSLLLTFINALLVLVLSCLLGWVVAAVVSRLRRKNIITVILSLAILAVYFFFTSRMNQMMTGITQNADALGGTVKGKLWPLYQLGLAATGKTLPMLCWCCLVIALFLLTYALLSRSFLRLATANRGAKKAVYRAGRSKAAGMGPALLRKELRRFLGSPVYMLNCGLGILFILAAAVFMAVKAGTIRDILGLFMASAPTLAKALLPAIGAMTVCVLSSMAPITAPSVSLEGKSLWVLQTLPVPALSALRAKEKLHLLLCLPPSLLCCLALAFVLGTDALTSLLMLLIVALYVAVSADLGLMMNLLKPNLNWTNETVPVKQGLPVVVCLFGGWFLSILCVGLCAALWNVLDVRLGMAAEAVLLGIFLLLMQRWLQRKGCRIFEEL